MKNNTPQLKEEFHKLNKENRLYNLSVPVVGLTGNIASGKSTVAGLLKKNGLSVIDADGLIHLIYEREDTKELLSKLYPQALSEGQVNFPLLREKFFKDPKLKETLSSHLYSKLPETFKSILDNQAKVIVYDVPLLFEKEMQDKFDIVITVSSTKEDQLQRLKKRDPESSIETLESIISQQLHIEEKEKKSDFVIDNNSGLEELEGQVNLALDKFFT